MRKYLTEGNLQIALLVAIFLMWVFVLPSFAGDDGGTFFSDFTNTLKDFLFVKLGKIFFLIFMVAGFFTMGRSLGAALVLFAVAILFAVGSGLANAVWNLFSSSTEESGYIIEHGIHYAKILVGMV